MEIDRELYKRVRNISEEIVQYMDNTREYWKLYNELVAICDVEELKERAHPFAFETLADFTLDDSQAVVIYRKALNYALKENLLEYMVSVRLALAERYLNLGERKESYSLAIKAKQDLENLNDSDMKRQVEEFLLNDFT